MYNCNNQYLSNTTILTCKEDISACKNTIIKGNTKYCVECSEGYKVENGKCVNNKNNNCGIERNDKCVKCNDGYVLTDECEEYETSHCMTRNNITKCAECLIGYKLENDKSVNTKDCSYKRDGECYYCEEEMNDLRLCVETKKSLKQEDIDHCIERSKSGCIRFEKGYYLEDHECYNVQKHV